MSPHLKCRKDINNSKSKRKVKKNSCSLGYKLRLSHINMILVGFVVFTLGAYLTQVVNSTTMGFHMRDTDEKLMAYVTEIQELEVKINSHKSVNYVLEKARELGMVTPNKVGHLSPIASPSFAVLR